MNGKRLLAINGSYRNGGITDKAVEQILADARQCGMEVEHVRLREHPIRFCRNCRQCMQQPGDAPGTCVLNDGMAELIAKIERADAYVLAAPTNFSAVTALFKRFMERLAPYGYWPWGKAAPTFRKAKGPRKPAVIISSCAAPGILGRLTYGTNQSLRVATKTIGGRVIGSIVTGLVAQQRDEALPGRARRKAAVLANRLAA